MQSKDQNTQLSSSKRAPHQTRADVLSTGLSLKKIAVLSVGFAAFTNPVDAETVNRLTNFTPSSSQAEDLTPDDKTIQSCTIKNWHRPVVEQATEVKWSNSASLRSQAEFARYPYPEQRTAQTHQILQLGDTGTAVSVLQTKLRALGLTIEVDGIYGPKTQDAVTCFQSLTGLQEDGVVGPETAQLISAIDDGAQLVDAPYANGSPSAPESGADEEEAEPEASSDEAAPEEDEPEEAEPEASSDEAAPEEDEPEEAEPEASSDEAAPEEDEPEEAEPEASSDVEVESLASVEDEAENSIAILIEALTGEEAGPQLVKIIEDSANGLEVRQDAIWALGQIEGTEVPGELVKILASEEQEIRETAKDSILQLGDSALPELNDRLHIVLRSSSLSSETKTKVAMAILETIAEIEEQDEAQEQGDSSADNEILEGLNISRLLEGMTGENETPKILEIIGDSEQSAEVRMAAIKVSTRLEPEAFDQETISELRDVLIEVSNGEDEVISKVAINSLRKIDEVYLGKYSVDELNQMIYRRVNNLPESDDALAEEIEFLRTVVEKIQKNTGG